MTEQSAIVVQQPGFLAPVIGVQQALEAYQAKKDLIDGIMKRDIDFGTIPGSAKPSLLKAGAEKATSFFGLHPVFSDAEVINDWTGKDHGGEPFFFYRRTCNLYRGDVLIASVDGSCNSWEAKYRYRWVDESALPASVDKSALKTQGGRISEFTFAIEQAETSGKYGKPAEYWQRFKDAIEQGNAAFVKRKTKSGKEMDAWEIDSTVYRITNMDTADIVNTVLKMADKRALVAATLIATGLSEYFTQDIEDYIDADFRNVSEPVKNKTVIQETGEIVESEPAPNGHKEPVEKKTERPYEPAVLKKAIAVKVSNTGNPLASDKQIGLLASMLDKCFAGEEKSSDMRHAVQEYLTGYKSSKDMPGAYVKVLLDWLDPKADDGGDYTPSAMAVKEAQAIRRQSLVDAGQMTLVDAAAQLGGVQA
jgi:hypothetical protein